MLEDRERVRLSRVELMMLKMRGIRVPLGNCWSILLRLPSERLGLMTIETFVMSSEFWMG